jgi:hypothetical protein
MVLLLLLFGLIIFGYNYITDSNRVRDMAQDYLSQLIGGRVEIQSATLSIFEGLRLEKVRVYVDEDHRPDSLLFSAQSFSLKYDPAKIITGKLEAAEIIAQKPQFHLTENAGTHEWNFYRLGRGHPRKIQPVSPGAQPPVLPEVLMRNARVEISEIRDGKLRQIGYEAMDGHLAPAIEPGSFNFQIQTRGAEGVGPWATGTVALDSNNVDAQLYDFDFRRDLLSTLPQEVRKFFEIHETSGRCPALSVHYHPGAKPAAPAFVIEMKLDDVNFSAQQEDYLSRDDVARRTALRESLAVIRPFYRLGGYGEAAGGRGNSVTRGHGNGELGRAGDGEGHTRLAVEPGGDIEHGLSHVARPAKVIPASFAAASSPPLLITPSPHHPVPASARPRASASSSNSPADIIAALTETAPIDLKNGSGTFIFTDAGLELKGVTGSVEGNSFLIDGKMIGYRPDAPFSIHIQSRPGQTLRIPETPRYFNSLPPLVRDIYSIIHPDGHCTMDMELNRPSPGSRLYTSGQVDVTDGKFACIFFPYTLSDARGRVTFGYDPKTNADYVYVTGVRGRGLPDGPNRNSYVNIEGEVGPLGPEYPDPQIVIRVKAENVTSEAAFIHALPIEVRQPLKIFDADHTGNFPQFHGDFSTTVLHRAGWAWRWTFDTDLKLDDAAGKLVGFPYPVQHMAADIHVRDGYVDIVNAHMKRGDASLRVDGRVTWGAMRPPDAPPVETKIVTDLHVSVKNLPVDKDLLAAMPPDQSAWLKRVGLGGKLDVDGRVFQGIPDPTRPGNPVDPDNVGFDLAINLHDGTLWPADGMFNVSSLSSRVHLCRDAIELKEFHGKRGGADVDGEGAIAWGDGPVQLAFHVKSKALPMDAPLYQLLPESGRESWDEVQPRGTLEADMSWRGIVGEAGAGDDGVNGRGGNEVKGGAGTTRPSDRAVAVAEKAGAPAIIVSALKPSPLHTAVRSPHLLISPSLHPSTLPSIFSRIEPGFHAVLKPQEMTCTLKELSYRLDKITGVITIAPDKVTITDAKARHGNAAIRVSGEGILGDRSQWTLKLSGKDMAVDEDFRKAMPPALVSMLDAVKFHGSFDFEFPKFVYRGESTAADSKTARPGASADPAHAAAAKPPAPQVDIDMQSTLTLKDCSIEAGVPMEHASGKLNLAGVVRHGKLSALQGDLTLPKAVVAGRDMNDISMSILKPTDRQELYLQNVHGVLAGGQVAGDLKLTYPDEGASRYLLSLVVRNADVESLVQDADKDLKGELTASLSLEGSLDDSAPRRGRGDVIVTGKELYHLPLMLGLFQVTNLSLPIASPFKTGTARYSIEGPRINFERVELKSDSMMMVGTGHLDFKTKQVLMTFTTDNPGGLKVPFLNDLIQNARGELLKITIKGSIKEPKVQAHSFGTITTTIDEVFKADGKKEK